MPSHRAFPRVHVPVGARGLWACGTRQPSISHSEPHGGHRRQILVTGSSQRHLVITHHDASVASIARQNWTRIGAEAHDLTSY